MAKLMALLVIVVLIASIGISILFDIIGAVDSVPYLALCLLIAANLFFSL
jgi:hypothetical protein